MNSTESQFHEQVIVPMLDAGEALEVWYERWSWTLTAKTPEGKPGIRYTPDFVVMLESGELVIYEVKGSGNARRQDLNRVKLFSDLYPMRVYVATQRTKRDGGGFMVEEY